MSEQEKKTISPDLHDETENFDYFKVVYQTFESISLPPFQYCTEDDFTLN